MNSFRSKKAVVLISLIAIFMVIRVFLIDKMFVIGNSMASTFINGDVLCVSRLHIQKLKRFDTVVIDLKIKNMPGYIIKRVIGLPNEDIQIIGGSVYINDEALKSDIGQPIQVPGIAEHRIHIDADKVFVLGDNRNGSSDSRVSWIGLIDVDKIIGVPVFVIFPPTRFGTRDTLSK